MCHWSRSTRGGRGGAQLQKQPRRHAAATSSTQSAHDHCACPRRPLAHASAWVGVASRARATADILAMTRRRHSHPHPPSRRVAVPATWHIDTQTVQPKAALPTVSAARGAAHASGSQSLVIEARKDGSDSECSERGDDGDEDLSVAAPRGWSGGACCEGSCCEGGGGFGGGGSASASDSEPGAEELSQRVGEAGTEVWPLLAVFSLAFFAPSPPSVLRKSAPFHRFLMALSGRPGSRLAMSTHGVGTGLVRSSMMMASSCGDQASRRMLGSIWLHLRSRAETDAAAGERSCREREGAHGRDERRGGGRWSWLM